MFLTRFLISLFEFVLLVVMSGLVIYLTYRLFIRANPDFDMEAEIKKNNIAVGILVAAILVSASMILEKGLGAVIGMMRLQISAPQQSGLPLWQIVLLILGHLVMSMVLALFTISLTLRLFGRLGRRITPGKELQKGNIAMGLLLAAVVLVAAFYVGEGVSALSKALVPQPAMGRIQIMK
ncbi:MAG TPA: DUF350 domain-containing protein [Candidatus Binatia bacterium]|nr:DUF350 domain-containing protein [Candidatus Binatia bacterium]